MNLLQDKISSLNEFYFFREFTYSNSTFHPKTGAELELADCLLAIRDSGVIFQLKERTASRTKNDEATELAWFKSKVLGKATRQIRNTLDYLTLNPSIAVSNHRNHIVQLRGDQFRVLHKLCIYHNDNVTAARHSEKKYHHSRTAGVIHLMCLSDYERVIRTLLTPAEFMDYLDYRASALVTHGRCAELCSEAALLGHYLHGHFDEVPTAAHEHYVSSLIHEAQAWDMSGIIASFPDRITTPTGQIDYYPIIQSIAELKRDELTELKKRFALAMENSKASVVARPYRMMVPRTKCGFVFIPITKDRIPQKLVGLQNFTLAHKYDQKINRCVGAVFSPDVDNWFTVDWCYVEFEWQPDHEMDQLLAENNPFRQVRTVELERYKFRQ